MVLIDYRLNFEQHKQWNREKIERMAAIDIDENIPRNSAMSDALIRTKTIFSKPTNPEYIKSNFIIF